MTVCVMLNMICYLQTAEHGYRQLCPSKLCPVVFGGVRDSERGPDECGQCLQAGAEDRVYCLWHQGGYSGML